MASLNEFHGSPGYLLYICGGLLAKVFLSEIPSSWDINVCGVLIYGIMLKISCSKSLLADRHSIDTFLAA